MLAEKLNYGDTIGVVGVSDSLKVNKISTKIVENGKNLFESHGFKIKLADTVYKDYYGSAGTKEERAEALMEMFEDDEVKAIICLTGGQTCNTVLDLLDYQVIKKHPKIFIGYSDITVLLQTIYQKTGLVTFSGPCFVEYGSTDAENFYDEFEQVFINKKLQIFKNDQNFIRKGNCKGKLLGTNLSCMMYQLGTPFFPDIDGAILAIESYITSPNECQRRFSSLKYAGVFDRIAGIIIGYNYALQKDGGNVLQMEDILLECTKDYNFPIIKSNDFGHKIIMKILPIGVNYKIVNNKILIEDEFLN